MAGRAQCTRGVLIRRSEPIFKTGTAFFSLNQALEILGSALV